MKLHALIVEAARPARGALVKPSVAGSVEMFATDGHAQMYMSPCLSGERTDGISKPRSGQNNEEPLQKGHGEKSNRRTAAKQCMAGNPVHGCHFFWVVKPCRMEPV